MHTIQHAFTILLVAILMPTSGAYAGLMQQCSAELEQYCGSAESRTTPSMQCLQTHRDELGRDCGHYLTRLTSAVEMSGAFKTACAVDYQASCGAGRFRIGKARACLKSKRDSISDACASAFDAYFEMLRRMRYPEEERRFETLAQAHTRINSGGLLRKSSDRTGDLAKNAMRRLAETPDNGTLAKSGKQLSNALPTNMPP